MDLLVIPLVVVILSFSSTNGASTLGPNSVCKYKESWCNDLYVNGNTCLPGYACTKERFTYSGMCGGWTTGCELYVAPTPPTPQPTSKPTVPPTTPAPTPQRTAGPGEQCEFITRETDYGLKEDCDTLAPEIKKCEDGYSCVGTSIQKCGAYKYCRANPTPRPTEPPTVFAALNEFCCPAGTPENIATARCNSPKLCDPDSGDNLQCQDHWEVGSQKWTFRCKKGPPTKEPTPAPTKYPTVSPTVYVPREVGAVCYRCGNLGRDWRDQCPVGTACTPDGSGQFCTWNCLPPVDPLPFLSDNPSVIVSGIATSSSHYDSVIGMTNDVFLAANPSISKIDVWEGTTFRQNLAGSSNSQFGYSMARFQDYLIVGAPEYANGDGRTYVYVKYRQYTGPTTGYVYRINSIQSFAGADSYYCGKHVAFSDGGDYWTSSCPGRASGTGAIYFYKRNNNPSSWSQASSVYPRTGETSFGRSYSGNNDYGIVGQKGSLMVMDIDNYVFAGKRNSVYGSFFTGFYSYWKKYAPTAPDDGFGASISANKQGGFVLVGTDTGRYYKYDWDGKLTLTNPRVFNLPYPVHFETYTEGPQSFGRSSSGRALLFTAQDDEVWGHSGDDEGYTTSIYPLSTTRAVVANGKRITTHNVATTSRPTTRPTTSPTTSPTQRPTPLPSFEYVQRDGRACGFNENRILSETLPPRRSTDPPYSKQCQLKCDRLDECRCFDFYTDNDRRQKCDYFSVYDSSITWTAGRTHSFIKQSDKLMRVKFVLYAIDKEGELVENADLRDLYGLNLEDIDVHTTAGEVGVIWDYEPSMHT